MKRRYDGAARSSRSGAATALTVVALMALPLAGCGVRTQSEPEAIDPADVPFDLLEPAPATTLAEDAAGFPFFVYFVVDGGLVPAVRTTSVNPGPATVLQALVTGPTADESAQGFGTALPPGTTARTTVVAGDLAVIELGGTFEDASGADAVTAVAQLVLTVTQLERVRSVQFRLDEEPLEVPRGDGALTGEPVGRSDYESLLATGPT